MPAFVKSFRKISKLWSDYAINSIPGIEKKLPWNAVAWAHEYTYFYIFFILDDADQELSVRLKWICRHNNNTSTDHRPYKHDTDLICSLFLLIFPLSSFATTKNMPTIFGLYARYVCTTIAICHKALLSSLILQNWAHSQRCLLSFILCVKRMIVMCVFFVCYQRHQFPKHHVCKFFLQCSIAHCAWMFLLWI